MMNSIEINKNILKSRLQRTVDVVDRIELENSISMLDGLDSTLKDYVPITATNSRYC